MEHNIQDASTLNTCIIIMYTTVSTCGVDVEVHLFFDRTERVGPISTCVCVCVCAMCRLVLESVCVCVVSLRVGYTCMQCAHTHS